MKKLQKFVGKMTVKALIFTIIAGCLSCGGAKFETSNKFSLLWEITGENLPKPSYLYGTIHVYDTNVFRISKEIYQAIDLCDNFALEMDMNNLNQGSIMQRIMISDPDSTLDKLLEPEIYAEVRNIPFIKSMGESVNSMKPFFLYTYLLVDNPINSVDLNLNKYAKEKVKNISGIETLDEQLDMVDGISLYEQAQGIKDIYSYCKRENLGFSEAGKKMFGLLQDAYKNQDIETLVNLDKEFILTSNTPASDSAMIASRNINMADRISDFIQQDKTLFVAIGALHLPDYKNTRGVVTLLKEKGYNLRPVLINLKID
jgi:uncharacterized protein YbaP (TraB family)